MFVETISLTYEDKNSGWIPVKDRKPEKGQFVFAICFEERPTGDFYDIVFGHYDSKNFLFVDSGNVGHKNVLYWKPVGELPEDIAPLNDFWIPTYILRQLNAYENISSQRRRKNDRGYSNASKAAVG